MIKIKESPSISYDAEAVKARNAKFEATYSELERLLRNKPTSTYGIFFANDHKKWGYGVTGEFHVRIKNPRGSPFVPSIYIMFRHTPDKKFLMCVYTLNEFLKQTYAEGYITHYTSDLKKVVRGLIGAVVLVVEDIEKATRKYRKTSRL